MINPCPQKTKVALRSKTAATLLGLVALLCPMIFPLPALPSEPSSDLMEMSIQDLMQVNIYSASRFEQKVSEAPGSITIITASEIQRYGYRTLAEILSSVPGIFLTYDRTYHYVGIRGQSTPGGYSNRFLLLIDGMRVNDPIYDSVFSGNDFLLDVDLIDRVEVVRGTGSSLYGANAFLGVINVITRQGKQMAGVEVSGEIGTLETYKGRISYGDSLPFGLETLVSGSYYQSEGNERLYYKEYDHPDTNDGYSERCDRERAYQLFGSLSYQGFRLEGAYSSRKKVIPTAAYETLFNDSRDYSIDDQGFLDLKYEHAFRQDWDLWARIHYGYYYYEAGYPYDYAEEGEDPDRVVAEDYARAQWLGTEAQISKTLFGMHRLILGAEYRDNFEQDQRYFDDETVYLDSRQDSEVWGIYLQGEFRILKDLILNAGARYDHYSTFGDTLNPRLGLIWTPFEKTSLKALYGQAFRPPNVYELYYTDGYMTMEPNPDLKPETIDTFNLILEQGWGDHLRASVSGYYSQMERFINQTVDPSNGLLVFENTQKIESRGVETELEGRWQSGLRGRISYAYQDSKDAETGRDLVNSPRHLAKFNLVLPLFKEKIFLGIEEQYTSERKTSSGGKADGYFVTNLTLFSQNLLKGLQVSASVYNLFNNNFADPAGEEHLQDSIKQDGRTFRLKVTYAF